MRVAPTRGIRRASDRRVEKARRKGVMKYIKYEDKLETATGQLYMIIDPDVAVQQRAQDKAEVEGKERFNRPTIEATFAQAVIAFVNGIPWSTQGEGRDVRAAWKPSPDDLGHAYATIKAFRNHISKAVEIEESDYTWLMDLIKRDGPEGLSVNSMVLKERLEDLVDEKKDEQSPDGKVDLSKAEVTA